MRRRSFLALLSTSLMAASRRLPANKNVKWALSANLWNHFKPVAFTDILDVMRDTGFLGIRMTQFPGIFQKYGLTMGQLEAELSKRNLHIATISFGGPAHDPKQQAKVLNEAGRPLQFLAAFGANRLVVFSPSRRPPETDGRRQLSERCARPSTGSANWRERKAFARVCTTTSGRCARSPRRSTAACR